MTEKEIQRAIMLWKFNRGLVAPNITLPWGEADVLIVTWAGIAHEYEVKTSLKDFRNDQKKRRKHQTYRETFRVKGPPDSFAKFIPNYFTYVFDPDVIVTPGDIPEYAGAYYAGNGRYHDSFRLIKRSVALHREHLDWTMFMARSVSGRMVQRYIEAEDRVCPTCKRIYRDY